MVRSTHIIRRLKHISILDPLRGIAALGVVLFHFSGSILPTIRPNPLEEFFDPARFGVQVFFVISGFIIPYALQRSGYALNGFGNFMFRRYLRIAPPAYIAASLVVLYHALAVWITGTPVDTIGWPGVNVRSILGNFTFHPALFTTQWYNFAFWSLMIEFQFYVLIGAILPFLMDPRKGTRIMLILVAIVGAKLLDDYWLFDYAPYFVIGMLVFLLQHEVIGRVQFGFLIVLASGICIMESDQVPLLFSLITAGVILSKVEMEWKALILLGDISYSLYITHVPVAYFSESLVKRLTDIHQYTMGKVFLLFAYTAIALAAAWLFHRYIERPFQLMSKKARKNIKGLAPDQR